MFIKRSVSEILFELLKIAYFMRKTLINFLFFWDEILLKSNKEVQR